MTDTRTRGVDPDQSSRVLFLATIGFGVSFAVWGLLSGLAPLFKQSLHLSATQVSLMVAIPVLLGSLGRLPMGLLADRCGPRRVLGTLMILAALPAIALTQAKGYEALLALGFLLGLGGTTFSVGVACVSPWFAPEKQGAALGIFGIGTVGQSIAVFFGPLLAQQLGMQTPFLLFGGLSLIWGLVVLICCPDHPKQRTGKSLAEALLPLRREPLCWLFSLFYFVTFGGFVALGIYLPSMLKDIFHLTPADAGARAAGFVLLATAARPIGGLLSDRIGGAKLLTVSFSGLILLALGLASQDMVIFTGAALGIALMLGLGNGAVFKLVPQYFPNEVGTVTGLVGAAGGLGGFFPPLILGILRDQLGSFVPGFVALGAVAAICLILDRRILLAPNRLEPA